MAKLQYAGSRRIEGCWKALHVLQKDRKLFASRYGNTSTRISSGRSVMDEIMSVMVMSQFGGRCGWSHAVV